MLEYKNIWKHVHLRFLLIILLNFVYTCLVFVLISVIISARANMSSVWEEKALSASSCETSWHGYQNLEEDILIYPLYLPVRGLDFSTITALPFVTKTEKDYENKQDEKEGGEGEEGKEHVSTHYSHRFVEEWKKTSFFAVNQPRKKQTIVYIDRIPYEINIHPSIFSQCIPLIQNLNVLQKHYTPFERHEFLFRFQQQFQQFLAFLYSRYSDDCNRYYGCSSYSEFEHFDSSRLHSSGRKVGDFTYHCLNPTYEFEPSLQDDNSLCIDLEQHRKNRANITHIITNNTITQSLAVRYLFEEFQTSVCYPSDPKQRPLLFFNFLFSFIRYINWIFKSRFSPSKFVHLGISWHQILERAYSTPQRSHASFRGLVTSPLEQYSWNQLPHVDDPGRNSVAFQTCRVAFSDAFDGFQY